MVVDSSALVAILGKDPDRDAYLSTLMGDAAPVISALTFVEASMVMEGRQGAAAAIDLEMLIHAAGIEVVPFDERQAEAARMAWRKFGKGRHPARLNLGDCCVYALAKVTGEPVLCKGDDFARTDIEVARLAGR